MPTYTYPYCWPSPQGDHFDRAQSVTSTPGFNGWTAHDTSSSGTPTYLCVSGEGFVATLDNTSEAQVVTLFQNDVLPFEWSEVQGIEFLAKVSGVDAVTTITMGLASARNSTADSVAYHTWFRVEGSASTSAIVVESDDATTDNDDKATGQTLGSTWKKFYIDLSNKSDIKFYIDDQRVASSTTFSMSTAAQATNCQPLFQLQKASGTGVPALTIGRVLVNVTKEFD